MLNKIWKKINKYIAIFLISGIFIGLLVAAHFQSSVVPNSHLSDEIFARNSLLKTFNNERLLLQSKVASARARVATMRKNLSEEGGDGTLIYYLDKLKEDIGLFRMTGEGVEILLANGSGNIADSDSGLIHAADLRDMINLLRTTNAKAISINGQRIVLNSTVNAAGNSIMINNASTAQPYIINTIGDPDLIFARINSKSLYPDLYQRIADKKVQFEIQKKEFISVPVYEGDFSLKIATVPLNEIENNDKK